MANDNVNELINSLLECDTAYLVTINGDEVKTEILCKDPMITVEELEEDIACALMDSWISESEQPEDFPSPIGKFVFDVSPDEEPCECEACQKLQEEEIKLSQQN